MIKKILFNCLSSQINWMNFFLLFACMGFIFPFSQKQKPNEWIRINQLGYVPNGIKVAVWCSKDEAVLNSFDVIDSASGKIVFTSIAGKSYGAYGPFTNTYRLNFSSFNQTGIFYLKSGNAVSLGFKINKDVYKGTADFCLVYL